MLIGPSYIERNALPADNYDEIIEFSPCVQNNSPTGAPIQGYSDVDSAIGASVPIQDGRKIDTRLNVSNLFYDHSLTNVTGRAADRGFTTQTQAGAFSSASQPRFERTGQHGASHGPTRHAPPPFRKLAIPAAAIPV